MKYVSVDIKTTGLDPCSCHILEMGVIIEDTEKQLDRDQCPTFHCYVDREIYGGSLFALDMNATVLHEILGMKKNPPSPLLLKEERIVAKFLYFLRSNNIHRPIFAGKNFAGFDLQFLKMLPGWEAIKYRHRTLDPTFALVDWDHDTIPPDTAECKRRAGLPAIVSHRALDDAWDIIQLTRIIAKEKL
ncbi:hypothetical protein LCGC14_1627240 [marine sediment metagenome]|uniref:Exonuclease domain-containing protein n=1 Tax=marine sediment metagenome TaxID=412755 RepID=A0A0F9I3Q4_9ZZZZ